MQDFLATFILCALVMLPLIALTRHWGLVDIPSGRKMHQETTPLVGGIAIFVSAFAVLLLISPSTQNAALALLCLVLVALGTLDDRFDLSPRLRFLVQTLVAVAMIYITNVQIVQIGNIFFTGNVVLGASISLLFTILCTVGVINSINMIDGMDGLAGSVVLVSLLALSYVAYSSNNIQHLNVLLAICGAVLGFLIFNARLLIPSAKVFLGDAGSMLLGFLLLWHCIVLSQDSNPALSPVAAGWIFGLPLVDTISVMVGRLRTGQSPFSAGRDHIHHKLLDGGLTVNTVLLIILGAHAAIVSIGLLLNSTQSAEPILFWLFVAIVVTHHFLTPHVLTRTDKVFSS